MSLLSTPFRVCLFGFAASDEDALARMLETPPQRTPHYIGAASLEHSDVVVANADNADALAELVRLELLDQAVYIGSDIDGEGWLKHPVDPKRLLHELDRLALRQAPWYTPRTEPADLGHADDDAATAGVVVDGPDAAPAAAPAKGPAPGTAQAGGASTLPAASPGAAAAAPRAPARAKPLPTERLAQTRALLIDDSDIALRYLETRLQRMGVQTVRATSSGKALEFLAQQPVEFVLLDVELGPDSDLDGLALCQHIKHHRSAQKAVPAVVMVSAHHAELDRARGALAGCDAYLGKPVDEMQLLQTLVQLAPLR